MDATADQGGTSGRPADELACRHSASRRARHGATRSRFARGAAAAVVSAALLLAGEAPAGAVTVVAGLCYFDLTVTPAEPPAPTIVPDELTWNVSDTGPCKVVDGDGVVTPNPTGTLTGSLSTLMGVDSANCIAGVLRGDLDFHLNVANFSTATIDAVVVVAGVPVALAGTTRPEPRLAGAGAFVQATDTVDQCDDGVTSTTWEGVFTFADPEVP